MISKVDRKYLSQLQNRYKTARRKQRIIILDELTKTTGYDRKHAGKLVRGKYRHLMGVIKHPRSLIYTREDADILEKVWELLGWIASKRLKPSLNLTDLVKR